MDAVDIGSFFMTMKLNSMLREIVVRVSADFYKNINDISLILKPGFYGGLLCKIYESLRKV